MSCAGSSHERTAGISCRDRVSTNWTRSNAASWMDCRRLSVTRLMKIYLCGPINACADSECIDWREEAKSHFPQTIDPMRRDYRGREADSYREIVDLDKADVRSADVLLVNYIKPSVGTSMEVFYAWNIGKPVVLLCAVDAVISPWLRYHSTSIVNTMADAVAKILEMSK